MRFITQAAKVLNEQKKSKRRLAVFMCLAAVVALGTVAALKMYGQAMSHKEKRLVCTVEAHRHTDACYDADGNLVCGQADYLVHTHNDDCYGAGGELVCHLPEIAAHTHTDACYTEEDVLVCTEQEQAHQHTDACYTPQRGELTCQMEEHTHSDDCYDSETGELTCQLEEHQHGDACYAWEEVLTCPYAAGGHQHSSDCYTRERGELTCPLEEHTHGDDCYDENGELTCQIEEHTHDDNCYTWEDVLTCQLEETPAGHTHTDACYEKKKVLTCGQLELHTHTEDCYDENGALACGLLELKEHTHQEECFETVELTDEEVAEKLEQERTPENAPADEDVPGDESDSVSGDSVSDDDTGSASGNSVSSDQVGSVSGDGAGSLSANEEPPIVKTYEEEGYIVTASYHKDANIPEEAELRAEMITAESDEEHYAEREAEIRKTLEDESLSMNALLKIGFYNEEDEEVEPEGDVTVTVQFLDEKGLDEGSPIAIVHFADGGSKVLNGGKAKDKSTTFKTNSFSEFGIIEGYEVKESKDDTAEKSPENTAKEETDNRLKPESIPVSDTYEYDDDVYHFAFHVEGNAIIPKEESNSVKTILFGDEDVIEENEVVSSANEDDTVETANSISSEETKDTSGDQVEQTEHPEATLGEEATEQETGEEDVNSEENEEEDANPEESEETEVEEDGAIDQGNDASVKDDNAQKGQGLEFNVELLDKNSEGYEDIIIGTEEYENDPFLVRTFAYSMSYDGVELDLSECKVTLSVTPKKKLMKYAKETESQPNNSIESETGEEVQTGVMVEVYDVADNADRNLLKSMEYKGKEEGVEVTSDESIFEIVASSQANPIFTVQYYANIDVIVNEKPSGVADIDSLDVIDTSSSAIVNGQKRGTAKLPQNNEAQSTTTKKLYLEATEDTVDAGKDITRQRYKVCTRKELREVYAEKQYNYIKAPSLTYFNILENNGNYELKKILVLKEDKVNEIKNNSSYTAEQKEKKLEELKKSTDSANWDEYENSANLHFTNRPQTAAEDENFILIEAGTVIRLVCDTTGDMPVNKAEFYDYDISDGNIYNKQVADKNNIVNRGTNTTHASGAKWYMYTKEQGINQAGNYPNSSDSKFAFGNSSSNTKTTMGEIQWNGNELNKSNGNAYGGCTFGLASSLTADKTVQYASGVIAPNLFNEKENQPGGKTSYEDSSLTFQRQGDTYTLTAAKVDGKVTDNLDRFNNPSWWYNHKPSWSNNYRTIWTNNFWPMDEVSSAGTNGHDLKFADKSGQPLYTFSGPEDKNEDCMGVPVSDDYKNHNCYFGMHYTVDFKLTKEYIGPLEYLFYGDDDMWVFLEGTEKKEEKGDDGEIRVTERKIDGQLICDIGGVHSSVGEYVDLWDYINKGTSGDFTLHFFYTERGASGSSCWMQFTLPSVSFKTPNQNTGTLRIDKEVTGTDNDDLFGFQIQFKKDGQPLKNDYAYSQFNADGSLVKDDVLIWNGGNFQLKAGQYIIISYLPLGAEYEITEIGPGKYVDTGQKDETGNIIYEFQYDSSADRYLPSADGTGVGSNESIGNASASDRRKVTGTIGTATNYTVKYTNAYYYELPETGGPGVHMIYAAVALLTSLAALLKYRQIKRRREGVGW